MESKREIKDETSSSNLCKTLPLQEWNVRKALPSSNLPKDWQVGKRLVIGLPASELSKEKTQKTLAKTFWFFKTTWEIFFEIIQQDKATVLRFYIENLNTVDFQTEILLRIPKRRHCFVASDALEFSVEEILSLDSFGSKDEIFQFEVILSLDASNFEVGGNLEFPQQKVTTQIGDYSLALESGAFSDVVVNIGSKQFHLHKVILAQSPVFSAQCSSKMLESKTGVIDIDDVDEQVFEEMITFLYTGRFNYGDFKKKVAYNDEKETIGDFKRKVSNNDEKATIGDFKRKVSYNDEKETIGDSKRKVSNNDEKATVMDDHKQIDKVIQLLSCADRFQVARLISQCLKVLIKFVCLENAVEFWALAHKLEGSCLRLKRKCLDIMISCPENMLAVMPTMIKLPPVQLNLLQDELKCRMDSRKLRVREIKEDLYPKYRPNGYRPRAMVRTASSHLFDSSTR